MTKAYGEENVEFLKVDGNQIYELSHKYSV